jgi:predicted secreted protein
MTSQPTCADRIEAHKTSRLRDFAALAALADSYDGATLLAALEDQAARDELEEIDSETAEEIAADVVQGIADSARESIYEFPLSVSRQVVHRIDLSTGGPADWLEVFMESGDDSTIDRIVYHFADWFDHAETVLDGADFDAAERFAREVLVIE